MKLTKTGKGIYSNEARGVEICKDSALCLDFPTEGWVLYVDGEWSGEAKTKKELVALAENMTSTVAVQSLVSGV